MSATQKWFALSPKPAFCPISTDVLTPAQEKVFDLYTGRDSDFSGSSDSVNIGDLIQRIRAFRRMEWEDHASRDELIGGVHFQLSSGREHSFITTDEEPLAADFPFVC
jgi:hypothetical protein